MPVVVIAPYDRVFEKTVSNMQEVAARGGRIILMTDARGAIGSHHQVAGDDGAADMAAPLRRCLRGPVQLCLSYRRGHGHRRRSAPKPRKIGNGGITA